MTGAELMENESEKSERARRFAALLANPLRTRLIVALGLDSPLSADDLAARVDEPTHKVRRHLNALVSDGIVAVAKEETRRGAVQRYFRIDGAPMLDLEGNSRLSERDRRRAAVGMVRLIFEETTKAASSRDLGKRADVVLATMGSRVDEQGWRELAALHEELLERGLQIVEESRERLETEGGDSIGVVSTQIFLEAPQHSSDRKP